MPQDFTGTSKIEKLCRRYFMYFIDEEVEYNSRPSWLVNQRTGKRLELDIFYPSLAFAVEVNGFIHKLSNYQKEKDRIKKEECKKRNIFLLSVDRPSMLLSHGFMRPVGQWIGKRFKIELLPHSFVRKLKSYHPIQTKWGRKVAYRIKIDNKIHAYNDAQRRENEINRIKVSWRSGITGKSY